MDSRDLVSLAILVIALVTSGAWRRYSRSRLALTTWAIAILICTVPVFDLHAHTHWMNVSVELLPVSWEQIVDDGVNILLYVPFGFFLSACLSVRRPVRAVAGAALGLSLLAETSQLFSHSRVPAVADVICNVLGGIVGAFLSRDRHDPSGGRMVNPRNTLRA